MLHDFQSNLQKLKYFQQAVLLDPDRWSAFAPPVPLAWQAVRFEAASRDQVPKQRGIYAFVVQFQDHQALPLSLPKKFTDLMHKGRSSEFADVCRRYTAAAGTIVALGHTAKNPDANNRPRYQGTTDILEDFDAVYVAEPLSSQRHPDVRVAKFTRIKCRAANPETVAYAYAANSEVPYLEKLASVRPIDPDDLDDYKVDSDNVSDPPVMAAFVRLIEEGSELGQMDLARAVAKECRVSQRAALAVLARYTGTTPREHLWTYETGRHGRRVFKLIDQTSRPT